jgi:hypothetical protein
MSSGGGTWYRSSSTGRTTREALAPLPLIAAARAKPAASEPLERRLPFISRASLSGLLVFLGIGLRGGEYLNHTSLQASGSGSASDSGAW